MKKSSILKRYALFVAGLYMLALGVTLIVRASLGTTPISSLNYVFSINTPLSLGTYTFLLNILLIIGQFMLLRGCCSAKDRMEILLQIPFSLVFGLFIDLNMWLTAWLVPTAYWMAIGIFAVGCLAQSIGVVFEIKPCVAMMSAEAFVKYAARRSGMPFGRMKIIFDLSLVFLAVIASLAFSQRIDGIREGSLMAAVLTGTLVTWLNAHIFTRRNFNTLRHLVPKF